MIALSTSRTCSIKLDWNELTMSWGFVPWPPMKCTVLTLVKPKETCQCGYIKARKLSPFAEARAYQHGNCSQSHTLVLLIVRSFAVSLYCSPVELLPCKCKPREIISPFDSVLILEKTPDPHEN